MRKLDASKELPSRLLLLKWGRNDTTHGPIFVGQKTLSELPQMQVVAGFDSVALDFEHNTVPGSPEYLRSQEPRPIGAKGLPFVELNVGVGIDAPRWTPDGRKFASEGHYEDLSGAVALDENDEVIFLHSGALCRQGSARDIHLFTAGLSAGGKLVALTNPNPNPAEATDMNMKQLLIALFTAAGFKADDKTADADLDKLGKDFAAKFGELLKLTALQAQFEELKTKLVPVGAPDLTPLSARIDGFKLALDTFTARFETMDRESIVRDASIDGKVVPPSALPDKDGKGGLTIPQLRALVADLPVTVPLHQRTPQVRTFSASAASADSPETLAIRSQLGITEDDAKKFGPKNS